MYTMRTDSCPVGLQVDIATPGLHVFELAYSCMRLFFLSKLYVRRQMPSNIILRIIYEDNTSFTKVYCRHVTQARRDTIYFQTLSN